MKHIEEAIFADSAALGAPAKISTSPWVTMKFGGTSVTGGSNWQIIAQLIKNRHEQQLQTFVVLSALSGVSNLLAAVCEQHNVVENVAKIIQLHHQQAREFNLEADIELKDEFERLNFLSHSVDSSCEDLDLITEIMSLGEIMSTKIAFKYLTDKGLDVQWLDARDWLVSETQAHKSRRTQRLSAVCKPELDKKLLTQLKDAKCVISQGFIARNSQGQNVLLGRGGSDSTGAYFSVKLGSRRLEIWTDVPGMFSANPHVVPTARLLKALHYDEAQEIAATGGSILHPRCLTEPAKHAIPVFIRSLLEPHLNGTCISKITPHSSAQVKAISYREGLQLISIDNVAMWHEVGFLAEVFDVFRQFGVSIDLVSTSETSITVSIDPSSDELANTTLHELLTRLETLGSVKLIEHCASVSLVGRKIRTMLHKLGPAMEVFSEHKVHLLSQAANDLNLTVVVNQDQGKRLAVRLHSTIIKQDVQEEQFGLSWQQIHQADQETQRKAPWWHERSEELLGLLDQHDCAYVYHLDTVRERAHRLSTLTALQSTLYAMKANPNKDILKTVYAAGMNFDCVSPGELKRLFKLFPDIDPQRILFTPNFASRDDYRFGLNAGVRVTLDNMFPLREWADDFEGRDVFVRLDPGQGRGHHELVRTAGAQSKFGIPLFELEELKQHINAAKARVVGIHAHSGSGIMDPNSWNDVGHILATAASQFPDVRVIDLGGGLGVPEKPQDAPLNIEQLDVALNTLKEAYPQFNFWMEPGRFIAAECGVLIARVTQTKGKGQTQYVGIATGMNSLIRPALYGAYHEIVNLSRLNEVATERYTVVGPNCETGDRLGLDRLLPTCVEGDVLLIANTGAYGYAMSSHYNLRNPAIEIVI